MTTETQRKIFNGISGIEMEFYDEKGTLVAWFPYRGYGACDRTRANAEQYKKDNPHLDAVENPFGDKYE